MLNEVIDNSAEDTEEWEEAQLIYEALGGFKRMASLSIVFGALR